MRLARDFVNYARVNRAWWMLLALPVVAFAIVAVSTTQAAVPYAVYTLF